MQAVTITRPDDWHVHFRDEALLAYTVPATAKHFARALVMSNLKPPLTTLSAIESYRNRIIAAVPQQAPFTPYMTLYLNKSITPETMSLAAVNPYVLGAKLYPAGATTNSEAGIDSLIELFPLLDQMQAYNLVLQIHGEVTHGDIFEREESFLKEYLQPILANFPKLRVILEHISTQAAVDFVLQASSNLAATITPHHLAYNRNQLLAGGIRPHYYCLPVLKHEKDQRALQIAACSGNPKFFAGTDSAPHALQNKENACGCAGIYSAPFALALYAGLFDNLNKLDKLNAFVARFGAEFYQLPINQSEITLIKSPQKIPNVLQLGYDQVVPMAAGEDIAWSIHDS